VSVGFYPDRENLHLIKFWVVRRGGGPKTLFLSDEQVDVIVEGLSMVRETMCSCTTPVGVAGSRALHFGGSHLQSPYSSSIRRQPLHFPNTSRYLFLAQVLCCETTIARLHRTTARRVTICDGKRNFSDIF